MITKAPALTAIMIAIASVCAVVPVYAAQAVETPTPYKATADGMIGRVIQDEQDREIAKVEDIILDKSGIARMIVVKNGDRFAAFDYDAVINRTARGDMVMPVSDKSFRSAAEFVYDAAARIKRGDKAELKEVPDGGWSVRQILDGNIIDSAGNSLGKIENAAFRNARITALFAGTAALSFDVSQLMHSADGKSVDYRILPTEAGQMKQKTK